jgi:hypothetical protein
MMFKELFPESGGQLQKFQLDFLFFLDRMARRIIPGPCKLNQCNTASRQAENESQDQKQEEDTLCRMQNDGEPITLEAFAGEGKDPTG